MDRREALLGGGIGLSIAVSGCLGSILQNNKRYSDYDREDLLLGPEAFPSGWKKFPEMNEDYIIYGTQEEDIFVGLDAGIHEDRSATKETFNDIKSRYPEAEEYELADECFWVEPNDEYALVMFRHSNAGGAVLGIRQSGFEAVPDRARAIEYANDMFEHWADL